MREAEGKAVTLTGRTNRETIVVELARRSIE
jgi:hypothetical protein